MKVTKEEILFLIFMAAFVGALIYLGWFPAQ